jgi:hypothetical protein
VTEETLEGSVEREGRRENASPIISFS